MRRTWLAGCLWLSACNCGVETLPDAGGTDAGAVMDAGSAVDAGSDVDAGGIDAGKDAGASTDAGSELDAGTLDAGMDAGAVDAGFTPGRYFSFRLAYRPQADATFTPPPFADLCIRPASGGAWTRLYGPPGIGIDQVGRQYRVTGGTWSFRIIDVNQPCDQPGLFESSQMLGNDSTHKRVTVNFLRGRVAGVVTREQFARFDDSMLGGQDWLTAYPDSPFSNLFFGVDGGAQVRIETTLVRFDGGLPGAMTLGAQSIGYRTGTGTVTSVFFNGAAPTLAPVFCDDFAPTAGVLSSCSTNLRPP